MNERIKKIRKDKGLTQEAFAEKLGVKRNTVATYEMGKSNPSSAIISLICATFSVNREWLEKGIGEMYVPVEDEEAALLEELLSDCNNEVYSIIKGIVKTYKQLNEAEKKVVKSFARDLIKNLKA